MGELPAMVEVPLLGAMTPWQLVGVALLIGFVAVVWRFGAARLTGGAARAAGGAEAIPPAYDPYSGAPLWPRIATPTSRAVGRVGTLRFLILLNAAAGIYYLTWRWLFSVNWEFWPLGLALVVAETHGFIDVCFVSFTLWRLRGRGEPPPPPANATVDVFITCYNEPVEIVRGTVDATKAIAYPHRTYILDDGNSPAMRAMAEDSGVGYIVRSENWKGLPRHAKAGNINNALLQSEGEFILMQDADQVPYPEILDRTLGYFTDPKVGLVQTPHWFYNVPPNDPLGGQSFVFYGPIMQGKDSWNAAFFCGSNAVVRRETLMQVGVAAYAHDLERQVRRALEQADGLLRAARGQVRPEEVSRTGAALEILRKIVAQARRELREGQPVQDITWRFQREAEGVQRLLVLDDMARIAAELADIPGLEGADPVDGLASRVLAGEDAVDLLAGRESSPLAAIAAVRALLLAVDVDRADEAQPVMPVSSISVTEDMATAMRMHALGWRSVYHHEILARGLAPEDLPSSLSQRLRWAQGGFQVVFRENPLTLAGLSLAQRLCYFHGVIGYLFGLASVIFMLAPALYLVFGWLPVASLSADFFTHLLPYLFTSQLLFRFWTWGIPTWRVEQYSIGFFPIWNKALWTAVQNVFFGMKLGFVVTPKTRQEGVYWGLVRWQLVMMGILVASVLLGLARMILGTDGGGLAILVNILWAFYDLVLLSVVFDAVLYRPVARPAEGGGTAPAQTGTSDAAVPVMAGPV